MESKQKKIISFCLWGKNPKYTIGAVKNAVLAKEVYPDWICRFHIAPCVPEEIIEQLQSQENTEVILYEQTGNWETMFWRFFEADQSDDIIILVLSILNALI
jgi:hypothetical protein